MSRIPTVCRGCWNHKFNIRPSQVYSDRPVIAIVTLFAVACIASPLKLLLSIESRHIELKQITAATYARTGILQPLTGVIRPQSTAHQAGRSRCAALELDSIIQHPSIKRIHLQGLDASALYSQSIAAHLSTILKTIIRRDAGLPDITNTRLLADDKVRLVLV